MSEKQQIRMVHPDHIIESPINPRGEFDEVELCQLAQSISRHGLIEPIVLQPANGGCFEIVAGHRRTRAWNLARKDYGFDGLEIPAVVVENRSESEIVELRLIENLQRRDLTPHEEAAGVMHLSRLLDAKGMPIYSKRKDIAQALGKSESWVNDRIRMAELAENVQRNIEALPTDIARKIGRMPLDVQKTLVEVFLEQREHVDKTDAELFEEILSDEGCSLYQEHFRVDESVGDCPVCEKCKAFVSGACFGDVRCIHKKNDIKEAEWAEKLKGGLDELQNQFPNAKFKWSENKTWGEVDLNDTILSTEQSWQFREKLLPEKQRSKKNIPFGIFFINPDSVFEATVCIDEDSLCPYEDTEEGILKKDFQPRLSVFIPLKKFFELAPLSVGSSGMRCKYEDWFVPIKSTAETPAQKNKRLIEVQKTKISNTRRALQDSEMCGIRSKTVFNAKIKVENYRRVTAQVCHKISRTFDKEALKRSYLAVCAALSVKPDVGVDWVETRHFEEAFEMSKIDSPEKLLRACFLPLAYQGICDGSWNDIKEPAIPVLTYKELRDATDKKWDDWEDEQLKNFKQLKKEKLRK